MLSILNSVSNNNIRPTRAGLFNPKLPESTPVHAGENLPSFLLYNELGLWLSPQPISFTIERLLNNPIILVFHSSQWKSAAKAQLQRLQALRQEVAGVHATVLLISSEVNNSLVQEAKGHSFNLYHDQGSQIASRLGLYSEEEPTWAKYSGLESNVPLLATYVVSEEGLIVFDHVEDVFNKPFHFDKFILSFQRKDSRLA